MTLDPALELSVEQLIRALNKKLFMECAKAQSMMPPTSRALVATLTTEVRSSELTVSTCFDETFLSQIDALERQAKDVLHEVITLRNSLRPVNRIPPEVIALCAAFVSPTDPRPIITLTQVCRHWRRAIISSPRNWASIGSGWKRLVPLCLERAGVVPLTVEIRVPDIRGEDETFLETIPSDTSRIAHLSLTGYSSVETVANIIPTFFTSTMDGLISLELQQNSRPAEIFPSGSPPALSIPWKLSKLTSLRLTQTPLYPALTSITSLVELDLVGYTTPFDFLKFITFLRSNPDLQSVTLDIQFMNRPRQVQPTKIISLPRLRRLSFTCTNPTDARLLISSVHLPRGISLEVVGSQVNPHRELHLFLPSPSTPIQKMLDKITTIKYQNNPGAVQFYGNDSYLSFRCLSFPIGDSEFSLFTATSVREFHLKNTSCSGLPWQLSQLPALEILVLIDISAFQSFTFLTQEPVVCPSLKTIAFLDCDLDTWAVEELVEAVARRRNLGAAWLHRIVIVCKTGELPDRALIHRLRESVPCVDARIDEKIPDLS